MAAVDGVIMATKSDCYKSNRKMTPAGIVLHTTGCNNPNLKRYVQPDDGKIGVNPYNNSMNEPGQDVCVHAIIGKDKNANVKTYQILPWDICCWGVGSGYKGSYNYSPAYIQFEICEDGLTDKSYCKKTYDKAVELCAYLCKKFNFGVSKIVSHHEAGQQGMGSSHVDPDNWWSKHGYTMDKFRKAVDAKLKGTTTTESTKETNTSKNTATSSTKKTDVPDVTYAVYTNRWLPAVKNLTDYAGLENVTFSGFVAKSSKGKLRYRVHTKNGRWLPWVDKYDTTDWNNGIAGIKGVPIDGIQMDLTGVDGYEVKYRVSLTGTTSYLPYVVGTEDYAGIIGKTIDKVQAYIVKK